MDLSPTLKLALQIIEKGGRPGDIPDLKDQIDDFLAKIYMLTGLREGFLDELRLVLYGDQIITAKKNYPFENSCEDIRERLKTSYVLYKFYINDNSVQPLVPQPAIVLKLNTKKLVEANLLDGLLPLLLSVRPIGSILAIHQIPPDCVERVFTHTRVISRIKGNFPTGTLDDIPRKDWLGGRTTRGLGLGVDVPPLCSLSYQGGVSCLDLAKAGKLALLKPFLFSYDKPPSFLLDVFNIGFESDIRGWLDILLKKK